MEPGKTMVHLIIHGSGGGTRSRPEGSNTILAYTWNSRVKYAIINQIKLYRLQYIQGTILTHRASVIA